MVNYQPGLDPVFAALADPTRRAMIAQLRAGERSISDLAAPHAMSLAGASKHVRVLENAGLIHREKRGRTHVCTLETGPLHEAERWLNEQARSWNARLDALEQALDTEDDG